MDNNFQKQGNDSQRRNAQNTTNHQKNIMPSDRSGVLDNEKLIRFFITGEPKLLYNQELQVDSRPDIAILKTTQAEVISIIKTAKKSKVALVKEKNKYLEVIQHHLTENGFVDVGPSKAKLGFIEYKQYPIPAGYQINYTTAKILWKIWWPSQGFKSQSGMQLNILIQVREQWYPIKNIIVHEGKLYIKTLVEEVAVSINEKLTWLNKLEKEEDEVTKLQRSKLHQSASVGKRYSFIQKAIAETVSEENPQALEQVSNSSQSENNLPGEQLEENTNIVSQIGAIEKRLRQMRIVHQNERAALLKKQEEEFNKLRQQLLSLREKNANMEMKTVEETLPRTSTPNPPAPPLSRREQPQLLLNQSVADEPLKEAETNNEQDSESTTLLQNLVNWLEKRS